MIVSIIVISIMERVLTNLNLFTQRKMLKFTHFYDSLVFDTTDAIV